MSPNIYYTLCASAASIGCLIAGYYIIVIPDILTNIMSTTHTQLDYGIRMADLFLIFGSIISSILCDTEGRRFTLCLGSIISAFGFLLMRLVRSYALFIIGYFLTGTGAGFALMTAPLYIAELAPAVSRGRLTSFPEMFFNLGVSLGYFIDFFFIDKPLRAKLWVLIFGAGGILSALSVVTMILVPESPRLLVHINRTNRATEIMLRPQVTGEAANRINNEIASLVSSHRNRGLITPRISFMELLNSPPAIRGVILFVIGLNFCKMMSSVGIDIEYFSWTISNLAKLSIIHVPLVMSLLYWTKSLFAIMAGNMVDVVGRKRQLVTCMTILAASFLLLLVQLPLYLNQIFHGTAAKILLTITYGVGFAAYSIGIGTLTSVYTSESLPFRIRAQGMSIGVVTSRIVHGLLIIVHVKIKDSGKLYIFLLHAFVACMGAWICRRCVRNYRTSTLEEIEMEYNE